MEVRSGLLLKCGCCGESFRTWEGYIDQDQDAGYGICEPCQDSIIKKYDADMDVAAMVIEQSLKPENQAKFRAMEPDDRRQIAAQAILDGTLKMTFVKVGP